MNVLGIGEVLWDIFPEQERFGGAALNFCANLQRLGHHVMLLSAVGRDQRGEAALEEMRSLGLSTEGIRQVERLPTGVALVGHTPAGEPTFDIPRPAAFDDVAIAPAIQGMVDAQAIDWLYFGTLLQTGTPAEKLTNDIASSSSRLRCFYDMNLREGQWNLALVERLSRMASILKTNEGEAETLFRMTNPPGVEYTVETFCHGWATHFAIDIICVTLGADGCCIYNEGEAVRVPGFSVEVADTIGSGDAFAAAFLHGYASGWPIRTAARFANALGALVASRAGATPPWTVAECSALANALP